MAAAWVAFPDFWVPAESPCATKPAVADSVSEVLVEVVDAIVSVLVVLVSMVVVVSVVFDVP